MRVYERVEITSRAAWRRWLAANHRREESIWLVRYKKAAGSKHVPYDDVVEEALCYGWIDSLPRKLDAERSMLLISPRRAGSVWSALNKRRVAALIAAGRMTPAGLSKIEAAKADGSWDALNEADSLVAPADLAAAFKKAGKSAAAKFEAFSPSSRRAILYWITSAKRDETRGKRVMETARLAALGLRANFPEAKGK